MIVENSYIKNPADFSMFFKGFVSSYPIGRGMCRPLLMLTFALNYMLSALNPLSYHLFNIFLHFINAILLYLVMKKLIPETPKKILFLITALFAVHPINSEAITYISSRSDLMASFFMLSSFIFYIKNKPAICCLFYIPALLTKETALCLPMLIAAYELIARPQKNNSLPGPRLIFWLSLAMLTAVYLLYRETFFSGITAGANRTGWENILLQSWVTFFYLFLFFAPLGLNIIHNQPTLLSITNPQISTAFLGILFLLIFGLIKRKKNPMISLGIFWILIGLSPKFYSRLSFPVSEHQFYLASMGIYIVIAGSLKNIPLTLRRKTVYLFSTLIVIASIFTFQREKEYQNPLLFWLNSSRLNPYSGQIYDELGREYLKQNQLNLAEAAFKNSLRVSTRPAEKIIATQMLAGTLYQKKNYKEAEKLFETLMPLQPPPQGLYEDLGNLYSQTGRPQQALIAWEKEITFYPQQPQAYSQIGLYYMEQRDITKARSYFLESKKLNPDYYFSYLGLAKISEISGDIKNAAESYEKALSLEPNDYYCWYSLGILYFKSGNNLKALDCLNKSIQINPTLPQSHYNLAIIYISLDHPQWRSAYQELQTAQEIGYPIDKELSDTIKKNL
jgi:tetratricopeptide (TPR) repeat protein